ncbi:hypothetical protein [Streptomyces cinnamoneus]|uniref:Uncharacterized protein n=1 Tax=Streptomyces cinnamoneus TaxID=53446 RepID=A0A918TGS5_STRCJ|nr:hypothetical protein [Streptomyces cinnamoneus]GHC47444.1 hypothetical protein GCM10010507_23730 [Streptomyces cinnamoneus]
MEHVTKPAAAGTHRARMAAGLAAALLALLPAAVVTATTAGWDGAPAQISADGSHKDPKEWNNTLDVPPPKMQ